MCAKILNSVGLILSIVGSLFWFVWGLSRMPESYSGEFEENTPVETKWGRITVAEARERDRAEIVKSGKLARFGMILIGIGFVFQLVATWVPQNSN